MKNSEETHKHTEAVYRGLTEDFNPGIKHVLLCGKAYHKALQGVTAAARAYTESLLRVGATSRSTCRGGTEDIGEAIFQIAEAQRDIQARTEESTKALFSELILPLEQKLENEFRRASGQYKKYNHGHKAVLVPYAKAHDSLRKFHKKTKNKLVYDEQKEAQYVKTLSKCQDKLDEFRVQGLKLALLEERKCHCFLLDRLSTIAGMNAAHHRQAGEMLSVGMPSWRHLSTKPHILPPEADRLLAIHKDDEFDQMNGSIYRVSNGYVADETRSMGTPHRRSMSYHDGPRQSADYNGDFIYATRTMPPSRGISVPPPPPPGVSQARAIYTHAADGDSKLSFTEGDVINLIGEPADGWHYGFNNRSGRYGWFPMSFTEPLSNMPTREQQLLNHRVKSMGDLDTRSLSDGGSFLIDGDIPGATRRPKSLYEGSGLRLVNNPAQSRYASYAAGDWNSSNAANLLGSYSLPRHSSAHDRRFFPDNENPYDYLHHDAQLRSKSPVVNSSVHCPGLVPYSSQPSPPLPLPPPPPPPPPVITPATPTTTHTTQAPPPTPTTTLDPFVLAGSGCLSPGNLSRAASLRRSKRTDANSSSSSTTAAPPPPPPPPLPSSSQSVLSQSEATTSGYGNRQSSANPPPPPPPILSASQSEGRPGPPSSVPPLPPGMSNGHGSSHPVEDYETDEEETNFKRNPKFAAVNLKKTVTNDRSKPRI